MTRIRCVLGAPVLMLPGMSVVFWVRPCPQQARGGHGDGQVEGSPVPVRDVLSSTTSGPVDRDDRQRMDAPDQPSVVRPSVSSARH